MLPTDKPSIDEILQKHAARIEQSIKTTPTDIEKVNFSQSYTKFKEEMAPELTRFEKWCHSLGNIVKLKISKKDEERTRRFLDIAHQEIFWFFPHLFWKFYTWTLGVCCYFSF